MSLKSKIVMIMEAKGASKAAAEVDKLDGSVKKVDRTAKTTSKSSAAIAGRFKKIGAAAKVGAIAVAGAAAVYAKQAVGATVGLAKSTMGLSRSFGLSTERASAWAAVAKSRDMDPSKLHMGFTKVSASVKSALDGSKGAMAGFKELGVSQKDLAKGSKNFDFLLGRLGDGFKNLKGGVSHAALAQKIFGKGGKDLLPIMRNGSKGIEEQLAMAKKYGAVIDDGTKNGAKKYIESQREMKMAQMGLQISFTKYLIPALLKILPLIPKLMGFFQRNSAILKPLIIAIGALAAAQWLLNIAMAANPVIAIVAGVVLLIAAFALAYKKITWFRNAVDGVVGFVKKYWPLMIAVLTGGLVPAIILIVKNFGRIVRLAKSLPGKVSRALSGLWDGLKSGFKSAINWVITQWNKLDTRKKFSLPMGLGSFTIPDVFPDIPTFAAGGEQHGVGSRWISGEAGPEIGEVTSDGVKVTPLGGQGAGPGPVIELHVNSYMDSRKVGEGVRRVALSDLLATSPA